MQYLVLCCFNEDRWENIPQTQRDAIMQAYGQWVQSTIEGGNHVATTKLRPSSEAATVRFDGGQPLVTDGPFAETREQVGGYHVLECENLDEAIAIAGRIPTLPVGGTIEVRPIEIS